MKVAIVALFLSLISLHAFADCSGLAGESESLTISFGGCDSDGIHFAHIQKGKELSPKDFQSYPFKEECEYTATGFTCRANGRTPLAGTTWENFKGNSKTTTVKPKKWKPSCFPIYYTCVKGCREGIPKEIHGFYEQSEEGECE